MKSLPNTLSIDIGGTGVKLIVLDAKGSPLCDREREETPHPATPGMVDENSGIFKDMVLWQEQASLDK